MERFAVTVQFGLEDLCRKVGLDARKRSQWRSNPGGPGTDKTGKTDTQLTGPAEETFTIAAPLTSVGLKQGASDVVTISLKRGKNFDEDVTLRFEKLPAGVTIEPATPSISHSDKETKVTIKASPTAAVGEHEITIKGEPTKGKTATNTLKLKIEKA